MNRTLILCSHGSTSHRGRAALASFVNAVRREAPYLDVVDAFVDVQEPDIDTVVSQTVGPRSIVPLMLTTDRSVAVDIARASHQDPSVSVTPPIGPDWITAEVGVRRLFEAGARPNDTILLAAGAVVGDRASDDVGKAARLLSAVWGGRVHVGTLSDEAPLAEAVDVARAYGQRVVVSPYVLAPGTAHDHITDCGADVVTEPLLDGQAPDSRLVRLVLARALARGSWLPVGHHPGPLDEGLTGS